MVTSSQLNMFSPSPSVPTFTLSDGTLIPALSWGNGTGSAVENPIELGLLALKAGIRSLDTAAGYNLERETGEVVRRSGLRREDVFVTTKLSQKDADMSNPSIPLSDVRASVLSSFERLGFQPDLLLIHNFLVPPPGEIVAFWRILEGMKDDGSLTASIGVSNFRIADLKELLPQARYLPVCIQCEFHPFHLTWRAPLLSLLSSYPTILLTAFGTLAPLLHHPTKTPGGPLAPLLSRIATRLSIDEAGLLAVNF
ncbi:hypothetical protein RQP46_010747 [Phenoliferia psychrophenolica]